jgi:hypothetical protein
MRSNLLQLSSLLWLVSWNALMFFFVIFTAAILIVKPIG